MTFANVGVLAWMVTVLPRMACYFFRWTGLRGSASQQGQRGGTLRLGRYGRATTIRVTPHRGLLRTFLPAGLGRVPHRPDHRHHLGTVVRPEAELRRLGGQRQQPSPRPDRLLRRPGEHPQLGARRPRPQLLGVPARPVRVVSVTGTTMPGLLSRDTVAQSPAASLAEVIARHACKLGWTQRVLEDTTVYLRRAATASRSRAFRSTPRCAPAPRPRPAARRPERGLPRRPRFALQHHLRCISRQLGGRSPTRATAT